MLKLALIILLTASAVGAQGGYRNGVQVSDGGFWIADTATPAWIIRVHIPAPLTDSAILCQPYFDLAIPDDIKNSVLWMFCDSIKYVVSAGLDSKISTDIVYFTYYGAMTVENYFLFKRVYTARDWHTPFAVLWQRKVMWSRE